jgi:hypothetical protein
MTAPLQRRRDPQPLGQGWELPAATLGGLLIAVALAALTGLGIASAAFGGGWVWPHGPLTVTRVIDGVLHGHPGTGLPPAQQDRVPGPVPVYACIAAAELCLLTTAGFVGVLIARYRRPGDARGGMATRREAEHALGLSQLRTAQAIIRPDLYGATGDHSARSRWRQRICPQVFHRHVHSPQIPADQHRTPAADVTVEPTAPTTPPRGATPG